MTAGTIGSEDVEDGAWCRWYVMTLAPGEKMGWDTHVMNVPNGIMVRTVGADGASLCFVPSVVAVVSRSFGACVGIRTVRGSVCVFVNGASKWITYDAWLGGEYKGSTRLCSAWAAEEVVRQIEADGCLPLMSETGGTVEGWPGDSFSVAGKEVLYRYKRVREEVEGHMTGGDYGRSSV